MLMAQRMKSPNFSSAFARNEARLRVLRELANSQEEEPGTCLARNADADTQSNASCKGLDDDDFGD
jgi:hypothetical protein